VFITTQDGLTEGSEVFVLTLNGIIPTVSTSVTIVDTASATGYLVLNQRLPPDRITYQDPITGAYSDRAPITGSYFYKFAGWNETGNSNWTIYGLRGALSKGAGDIKLYKSDGTLVETLTASQLIIHNDVVEFPFATRTLGTDYYVLMDQGVIVYCGFPNHAITQPTIWNFNTPLYEEEAYVADPTLNLSYPLIANAVSPNSLTSCPGNLILSFNEFVSTGSGNVYIRRLSDDSILATIPASSGIAIGNTINYGAVPSNVYDIDCYVTADWGVALASCFLEESAIITKARNFIFNIRSLQLIDFRVDSYPFEDNKTKVNPQTNIILVFNKNIFFGESGSFYIYSADGGLHQEIDILTTFEAEKTSELIWIVANELHLNPTTDLELGKTYYVTADPEVLRDNCPQYWAGISNTTTVRFDVDSGPTAIFNIGVRNE
jgi:hypothetical protein